MRREGDYERVVRLVFGPKNIKKLVGTHPEY